MMLDITFDDMSLTAGETYYMLVTPRDSTVESCVRFMCHKEDPSDYTKYVYRQLVDNVETRDVKTYSITYNADPADDNTGHFNSGEKTIIETVDENEILQITDQMPINSYVDISNAEFLEVDLYPRNGVVANNEESIIISIYDGKVFDCWRRDTDVVAYKPGMSYSDFLVNSDLVFNAEYTITRVCDAVEVPAATRTGYTFLGWATSELAALKAEAMVQLGQPVTDLIQPGTSTTFDSTVSELYAVWQSDSSSVSDSVRAIMYLKVDSAWIPILPD
jgi:uncharacterized repeat protein (TIGR02543 family)